MPTAKKKTFVRRQTVAPKKAAAAKPKIEPVLEPPVAATKDQATDLTTPQPAESTTDVAETPAVEPAVEPDVAVTADSAPIESEPGIVPTEASVAAAAQTSSAETPPASVAESVVPEATATAAATAQTQPESPTLSAAPTTAAVGVSSPGGTPPVSSADHYGFHDEEEKGGRFGKKTILLLFVGLLFALFVGGGVYFYLSSTAEPKKDTLSTVPTKSEEEPSPTPEEEIDLSKVSVQVLNGSGIAGEAGKVATLLEDEGFEGIETGNASSSSIEETTIEAKRAVSEDVVVKLTEVLSETYALEKEVEELDSENEYDVIITLGTKKAADDDADADADTDDDADTVTPTP